MSSSSGSFLALYTLRDLGSINQFLDKRDNEVSEVELITETEGRRQRDICNTRWTTKIDWDGEIYFLWTNCADCEVSTSSSTRSSPIGWCILFNLAPKPYIGKRVMNCQKCTLCDLRRVRQRCGSPSQLSSVRPK